MPLYSKIRNQLSTTDVKFGSESLHYIVKKKLHNTEHPKNTGPKNLINRGLLKKLMQHW